MMYVKEKVKVSFFLALPLFLSLFLQLIPYFILLNDCDKEQKKESLGPRLPSTYVLALSYNKGVYREEGMQLTMTVRTQQT